MTNLDEVLTAVRERVPYLRCATDAVAGEDGWVSCAELIADPARLRREIDATAEGRRSSDPQVLASLYAQSYAFRVPSVAIAAWALGLPGPSIAPDVTLTRITRHRPGQVATTARTVMYRDAIALAGDVIDGHLVPFLAAVRASTRIGARLLWGNVAASIASIFRAVQSVGPTGDADVRDRAHEFFHAVPDLATLGRWSSIAAPGALGWYWDRSNCCLWYQTRENAMCDDCSLHDDTQRAQRRRGELITAAEADR